MKQLLRIEELAMCLASFAALYYLQSPWYGYIALLLAPDISMLAYLGGNKIGAIGYNFFHHKALGIVLTGLGVYTNNPFCLYAGIVLFGHASLDRIFGYGLKYNQGFGITQLG